MKMKKTMSILMSLVFISTSATTVFAANEGQVPSVHESSINGTSKIGQVLNVQESKISGNPKINEEQTVISDVLTFDQIVEMIAKDRNISKTEASNQVIENYAKSHAKDATLSTNNVINATLSADNVIDGTLSANYAAAVTATYRTVSSQFTVTSTYKPSLTFYCETSEGGYFWGIVKILDVEMNRSYNGISKQFGGTVYTNLENAGKIYWIVNGDFFNNGTTTGGGGVEIGIGQDATLNFSLSYSSNHYQYCYQTGNYIIQ